MPGMMDTILNLGLNDERRRRRCTANPGDERFAYDSYRRFITMYSDVVLDDARQPFRRGARATRKRRAESTTIPTSSCRPEGARQGVQGIVLEQTGKHFPRSRWEQLWGAIGAVFDSWMSPRAITYRKLNDIPESWGTAVNVQSMVFGNMGDDCATGVAFTRDPSDRREEVLRRVPRQRAGRGRRGRHPHSAADQPPPPGTLQPRAAHARRGDAQGIRRARRSLQGSRSIIATCRTSSSPSSRASSTCCRPERQAHGRGGAPDRHRDGARGADRQEKRRCSA